MPRRARSVPSEFRAMWLFAMFDLPVTTPEARRRYAQFRTMLLDEGFIQLQYSVYARYCGSEESAQTQRRRVTAALPPEGQVRLLSVTDHQFGRMEVYDGKKRGRTEGPPRQMLLF